MKKIILLAALFLTIPAFSQTLTVPKSALEVDIADLSANMWEEFTNWINKTEIVSTGAEGDNAVFSITDSWDPENSELNEIRSLGGNTDNWPLYIQCNDSTFFTEKVTIIDDKTESVLGRNTLDTLTWGQYFNESHVIYYRPGTSPPQYLILGAYKDGSLFDLETMVLLRNAYTQVTGYMTEPTRLGIANLEDRNDW